MVAFEGAKVRKLIENPWFSINIQLFSCSVGRCSAHVIDFVEIPDSAKANLRFPAEGCVVAGIYERKRGRISLQPSLTLSMISAPRFLGMRMVSPTASMSSTVGRPLPLTEVACSPL